MRHLIDLCNDIPKAQLEILDAKGTIHLQVRVKPRTCEFTSTYLASGKLLAQLCQKLMFPIEEFAQYGMLEFRQITHLNAVPILTAPLITFPRTVTVSVPTFTVVSKTPDKPFDFTAASVACCIARNADS